ncbi:MAG: hypothetical protein JWR46_1732 [Mycobacterium sp.]|jgi:hypothetical protein|nr:hypothetical protein [Mycobacterium sp.]
MATLRSALNSSLAKRRSVTSRATPYITPASGRLLVLHSNQRTAPSARMCRHSKPTTGLPAAS